MLPSVQERKKNKHVFNLCYTEQCKLKNLVPLGSVRAHLFNNSLDFVGDRVKLAEWYPIMNALSLDRSLNFIAIRCMQKNSVLESVDTEVKAKAVTKRPVLFTQYVLLKLMRSLKECMSVTKVLTCIELEGLPMSTQYVEELCKGIATCESLQNVSLHRSHIGDHGVELVCRTVKYLLRILSLDFSACGLGERGAMAVVDLVRYQKLVMYSDHWEQTLRNRTAEMKSFPGLRRITLNHNPKIGDRGALQLMDVVGDNIWIKAVDMQNCGLTDATAGVVLTLLQTSTELAIVDVRSNQISPVFLKKIMLQLGKNNADAPHDYHWLSIDPRFIQAKQPCRVKTALPTASRATSIKRTVSQPRANSRPQSSVPHYAMPLEGPRIRTNTSGVRMMETQQMEFPPYSNMMPTPSPSPPPPPTQTEINLEMNKELVRKLSHQLEEAEEANKQLARQVELEVQKRLKAEAQVVTMRTQLDENIVLKPDTVEDIQDTFSSFSTFIKIVRASGFGSQEEESSSRDVFMTDDELQQRMQLVLNRSEHAKPRPRRGKKIESPEELEAEAEALLRSYNRAMVGDDGAGDSPRVTAAQIPRRRRGKKTAAVRSYSREMVGDDGAGDSPRVTAAQIPRPRHGKKTAAAVRSYSREMAGEDGAGDSPRVTAAQMRRTKKKVRRRHHRSRDTPSSTDIQEDRHIPMGEIRVTDAPPQLQGSKMAWVSPATPSMISETEVTSSGDSF